MERYTSTFECDVCGGSHVHSIMRYEFETDNLNPGRTLSDGPVHLSMDEYMDWWTDVEDGFNQVDQGWDSDEGIIFVEVIQYR